MKPRNIEFFALLEASGWSPAEAARRLELDPSSISQYKKDTSHASAQVIQLFKLMLVNEKPEALRAAGFVIDQAQPADELNDKLADLKQRSPDAYETARRTIEVLHDLTDKQIKDAATGGQAQQVVAANLAELAKSPKAASPGGKDAGPAHPAPPAKGAPPAPAKKAPSARES